MNKIKITPFGKFSWVDSNTDERFTLCGTHVRTVIGLATRGRYTDARQEAPDAPCDVCRRRPDPEDGW
jgi:hypothetical protein